MTAQLSRERLEEIIGVINAGAYGYSVSAEEIGAMARMAMAGMDNEPVAWWTGPEPTPTGEIESIHDHETGSHSIPLCPRYYHPHIWHKPAPVAVPDELTRKEYKRRFMEEDDFDDTYRGGWNACRAAMLNKVQPVQVPEPITRNDADGWWMYKGRRVGGGCAEWYNRALEDCRAAMLKAGPVTAATVPEGRVAKAILHACECFLLGCSVDTKNYENYFYDEETGISFTIYDLAEKLGIVNCIGNRCWSLTPKVRDEINQVYRKYALLMLAAAPAAPEQEV